MTSNGGVVRSSGAYHAATGLRRTGRTFVGLQGNDQQDREREEMSPNKWKILVRMTGCLDLTLAGFVTAG